MLAPCADVPASHRIKLGAITGLVFLALASPISNSLAQTAETPTPTPTATSTASETRTPTVTLMPELTQTPTPDLTQTPTPTPNLTPTPTATPFVTGVPCVRDDPHTPGGVRRDDRRGVDDDIDDDNEFHTGNGRNFVIVHNCTDQKLRVRASIQLNTIPGRKVRPINEAYAEGSCLECQTLAVALQIDLYRGGHATDVEPQNYAIAINTQCTRCITVSRAIQYVQPVEDPKDVSSDVEDAVQELDRELNAVQQDPNITLADAEARLNSVLERFNALGGWLAQQREEKDSD